ISERLDPYALKRLINSFLTPMTTIIQENQGFIDKYIGDCIMALWNAPLSDPQHARHAISAALAMREALKRLNAGWRPTDEAAGREHIPLDAGIGLNTGVGCVGNMGSEQRFDYSVLGDTVNVAARLEALSRAYAVDIVVGEDTAAQAGDFAF